MSSTNKTAELQLSQFVGTDIPSILTDYNGDMQKIDAGVREVKQATAGAVSDLSSVTARVTNAEQEISGLNSTVQGIASKVITAEGDIDSLEASVTGISSALNTKANASDVTALQGDVNDIEAVIPDTASTSNKLATMQDVGNKATVTLSARPTITTMDNAILNALNTLGVVNNREVFSVIDNVGNTVGTIGVLKSNDVISYNLYLNRTTVTITDNSQRTTENIFRFFKNASANTYQVGETEIKVDNSTLTVNSQTAITSTDGSETVEGMFISAHTLLIKKY